MSQRGTIIFIDDERAVRVAGQQTLELAEYEVIPCTLAEQALRHLSRDWPGIVISDVRMPGMDGLALLQQARGLDPELPVILITGHGDIAMAVHAIHEGAYDFIEKPFPAELLVDAARRALERRRLVLENRALKSELAGRGTSGTAIVGKAFAMERLRATIANVAGTDVDVLILGETGTGKELVARALHDQSARRCHHFVALNCGAMPENIIESELFGHMAGAFTSAHKRRIGRIEYAQGGTVFLDEIESMPLHLQVKILRVLQERVVEPLGSNEAVPVDIRVVAASKVDLKQLCAAGKFREDLYYRLHVVALSIPPLRDRREDIMLLFQHFASLAAARYKRDVPPLESRHMHRLISHTWPGNVRELRNVAERFVLGLSEDSERAAAGVPVKVENGTRNPTLAEQVDLFERTIIEGELVKQRGNVKSTYEALGLPRKTFYDKLRRYGLRRDDYTG